MIKGSFLARDEEYSGPHRIQFLEGEFRPGAERTDESLQVVGVALMVKPIREVLNHGVYLRSRARV